MTTTSNSSTSSTTPPNSKSGSMKRNATLQMMTITKELEENVANLLPGIKLTFKTILKIELKNGDKLENRLLAFAPYRLYIITVKGSPKLEHSYNYVDINYIQSLQPNRISFGCGPDSRVFTFQSCDMAQEEINAIIFHLVTTLKTLFPHTPIESFFKKIEVEPRYRLESVYEYVQVIEEKARFRLLDLPCGGFSNQYACFCDQTGSTFREEVAWDIDTIYAAHNNTELSILDFEHLELKDLVPIIGALAYNGWFTKFRVSNFKVVNNSSHSGSDQLCEQIINLVRRSVTLEDIYLDNTGIRADFVNKLFSGLLLNNQTSIRAIDLSNNPIEDKGLKNMTAFVAKSFHMATSMLNSSNDDLSSSLSLNFSANSNQYQQHSLSMSSMTNCNTNPNVSGPISAATSAKLMYKGLVHLNLSHCGITSKGICELSESLYLNKSMFTTLTYLNLSDNSFKDDLTKLYNFLAQPNNLVHLDLSATDCNLDSVFGALLHGCTNNLVHINLSRNQFSSKKSSHKELIVPSSIKKFFSTAIFLRTLNLSNNRLPPEALKAVLLGLACNESATDIRLNLSSNEFKSNGATVLELSLSDIRCVSGLDLSDNSLDMDLIGVVNSISNNKSVKYLSIGRNFNNIKAKHMPKVLDAFVQLLQSSDCSLESLSLVDSKLRGDASIILNALGSNQSLINIDVSGNMMGLSGAKTLAKALQVNTHLETIYLDRNMITTPGFIDIAYALERNFTLKYLPIPVQDVQAAMIKMADRTEAAITKIQEYIRRNNLPQTAILRNLRLHNLANSSFIIDNNLYSKIERTTLMLHQLLRNRPFDASNRIPSVDSIDINLNSDQDNTIVADEYIDDISRAESLLRDAHNVRHLCSKIQELYTQTQTMNGLTSLNDTFSRRFSSGTISRPIEANIAEFAKELKRTFEQQIASISELMIQYVKEEFPQVFAQCYKLELDLKNLYHNCINGNNSTSSLIPSIDYFHMCLTESAGTTWSVKLEQILNTIASQMCNKVLLEISRCLSYVHKTLAGTGMDSKSIDISNICNVGLQVCNGNSARSSTPDVLRTRTWVDSSSSHDSTDLNLSHSDANMLDIDGNNAIATPKLQNAKRQNVYIRKLRPQSVLDGAVVANEDFPDLLPKAGSSTMNGYSYLGNNSSPIGDNYSETCPSKVKHLTKMRPRNRKTRAPTRVAIVDTKATHSSDQSSTKLDEGLDSFFPVIAVTGNSSNGSIDIKDSSFYPLIKDTCNSSTSARPQPQPRKILKKFGFKSNSEHIPSDNSVHVNLKNDDFLQRSSSPTYYANTGKQRTEHVSICSDPEPRGHSPLPSGTDPQQHNEFLAEIRAKQEKRSHTSTPQNEQLTFAATLESMKRTSPDSYSLSQDSKQLENNNNTINLVSSNSSALASAAAAFSVAKRATMFGELHKSPSKVSINQCSSGNLVEENPMVSCNSAALNNNNNNNNYTNNYNNNNNNNCNNSSSASTTASVASVSSSYAPSIKQRPKSMVGLLGAKFELSVMSNTGGNK